jgi:hypothetical protein
VNRYNKPRWPAWMVFAVTATLLVVGSVSMLGAKMIDSEWKAGNVVLSLRAEANQLQASQKEALKHAVLQPVKSVAPSESDPEKLAQWQDIASQVQHPYFESQIAILLESKNKDVLAPWVEHPIPLSQFAESNRPFLDTIYQRCPPLDEPTTILAPLGTGSLDRLKKFVFLDAASCLHTGDRERFDQALATFYQINQTYWGDLFSVEPLVCLLHRALDVSLLSPQKVEVWVERLCRQHQPFPSGDFEEYDRISRLQAFSGLDRQSFGYWVPPSIVLANEALQWSRRKNQEAANRWNPQSIYRTPAIKLALLSARVALLNHIQQQSLPKTIAELETARVIQNAEKVITANFTESVNSLIEYAKIGEVEAVIRTAEVESLGKGSYPVHETYTVLRGSP